MIRWPKRRSPLHPQEVRLEGDRVVVRTDGSSSDQEISLAELAVVGEFTTDEGPLVDDYYFVFVARGGDSSVVVSFYARGRDALLADLSRALGHPLHNQLVASTDFASSVLWPPELEGESLLDFFVPTPKTAWQRLLTRLWPTTRWCLSAEVRAFLAERDGVSHASGAALPEP